MTAIEKKRQTFIIDLEKLNSLNAEGCAACGRKFTLGETVVRACGAWEGPPKLIHEQRLGGGRGGIRGGARGLGAARWPRPGASVAIKN